MQAKQQQQKRAPKKGTNDNNPNPSGAPAISAKTKKRRARKLAKRKDPNAEAKKQFKGDPRAGVNGITTSIVLSTQLSTLTEEVPLGSLSIWDWAKGIVTLAVERGMYATSQNPWDPYFAYQYLIQILLNYASGTVPQATTLPYVVLAMCKAIAPKTTTFANGKVTYQFSLDDQITPPVDQVIGYNPYGYTWNLRYVPSVPTFDLSGFPLAVTSGFPTYTPEAGAAAFQSMCLFLADKDIKKGPFRPVALSTPTTMDRDFSVYAYSTDMIGQGAAGASATAGWGSTAHLEAPIFKPQFAVFNESFQPPQLGNRMSVFNQQVTGDALFLGGFMTGLFKESEWNMKRYPKLHAVDFLEFGDVVAQWVTGIVQSAINDLNPGVLGAGQLCPLTLQEVLLLLRNVIMTAFKDSQRAVQTMYPIQPASGTDNQFVPYVASATTCFLKDVPMQLPIALIENIRALVGRCTHRTGSDIEWFLPVLGQYADDALESANYQVTQDGVTASVFKEGILYSKRVFDEKTATFTMQPSVETFVSLVDGQSSTGFVAINNPKRLAELAALWNDWLTNTNVQNYSMTVGTLGTEQGVNILTSVNMTRHWVPNPDITKEERFVDIRLKNAKYAKFTATQYATRLVVADTAQSVQLAAPYEQVLSTWILPIILQQTTNNGSTNIVRWSALSSEPYEISASSGFDGMIQSELHSIYASKMIRQKLAVKNDWDNFFEEMSKQARGGILSGLVASFVGSIAPGAAGIANTIAGMLPI